MRATSTRSLKLGSPRNRSLGSTNLSRRLDPPRKSKSSDSVG